MTTEQYDTDLKTLVKEKFSLEDLEKIRLDIVLLLDKECEKHDLSDNQSYIFGCIILDAIQGFYKDMTRSSYSLDEDIIKRLIDTYAKTEKIFFPQHKIKYVHKFFTVKFKEKSDSWDGEWYFEEVEHTETEEKQSRNNA